MSEAVGEYDWTATAAGLSTATVVLATPGVGRVVNPDDFADLTPLAVLDIEWQQDGRLLVRFAGPLSPPRIDAIARRIVSRDSTDERLLSVGAGALLANLDYLAMAEPTAEQTRAQVQMLTQQVNALIRLTLTQ